ncbi:ltah-1.1 [Symbiodinium sp. KB8]|nr:ltah-1.1 [Symbiodinium sp. KB8]
MASDGAPASAAALRARNLDCPSTLSNFLDLVVTNMHLDLAVDFEAEVIEGTVKYTAEARSPSEPSELVLDTRHLEVIRVEANGEPSTLAARALSRPEPLGRAVAALRPARPWLFRVLRRIRGGIGQASAGVTLRGALARAVIVGEGIPILFKGSEDTAPFGRALHIPLGTSIAEGESVECSVTYRTTSQSSAVQFLKAEQTADKEAPFLFTQCQAIHARSLLPCQDTPGVKCTFTSSVRVPTGITALMSALPDADPVVSEDGAFTTFSFKQPVPVPSYLIAVAAGLLAQRPLAGEETMSVWAEPSIVDASAHEFAETPAFVRAAESIMGPYEWGRYDLLVLPPTFPYGGMENPCLTFVTPTLLAGDRSLADVVAHEICHSWAGNLVTCATWEHFWLNEGATMMAQRLIVAAVSEASSSPHWGAVRGETNFQFDAAGGEEVLNRAVDDFVDRGQSPFTVLVPALDGVDPDDSFSSVPYEKGFLLFDTIRRVVGDRARFLGWFKSWFATFRRRCATSEDLKLHVIDHFAAAEGSGLASDGAAPIDMASAIAWDDWFALEGRAVTSPLEWDDAGIRTGCSSLAAAWAAGEGSESSAMDGWSAGQKIRFLDEVVRTAKTMRSEGKRIALSTVSRMDAAFGFGASKNCEVSSSTFTVVPRSRERLKQVQTMMTLLSIDVARRWGDSSSCRRV